MRADNGIGEAGAEHVAGAIRENTTLTTSTSAVRALLSLPLPPLGLLLPRLLLTAATAAAAAPPFRALLLCCCFAACCLPPPPPLPPPSHDARLAVALKVSGGVCADVVLLLTGLFGRWFVVARRERLRRQIGRAHV